MIVREIQARSILSKSAIQDYALNAYVGCAHACVYCYARFMKRFTGHQEPWGTFVDAKVNAPELLAREIRRKKPGRVWVSGVCDAYQPLERTQRLTRRCLEILVRHGWPVTVQTKSPLVLRDLDLLRGAAGVEVGLTITTAHERIRRIFEPGAPPIPRRIEALAALREAGVPTFVMVAPLLPGAEELAALLAGKVDRALIDRCNYHHADRTYRAHGLQWAMREEFFQEKGEQLRAALERAGIPCRKLY